MTILPLESHCHAARIGFANPFSEPMPIVGACIRPSEGYNPVAGALVSGTSRGVPTGGTSGATIYFDGAGADTAYINDAGCNRGLVVGGNAANTTNELKPFTIVWSDWTPVSSIPRTDGGTNPLLFIYVAVGPGSMSTAGARPNPFAHVTSSGCRDRIVVHLRSDQAGDWTVNPGATGWIGDIPAPRGNGSQCSFSPVFCLQYLSLVPGIQGVISGDSLMSGPIGPHDDAFSAAPIRAAYDLSGLTLPICVANMACGGEPSAVYNETLRRNLAALLPSFLVLQPLSRNDGMTQSRLDSLFADLSATSELALARYGSRTIYQGAYPIPSVDPQNGGSQEQVEAWLRARDTLAEMQDAGMPVYDGAAIIGDAARPWLYLDDCSDDGTHPNDTATERVTPLVRKLLVRLGSTADPSPACQATDNAMDGPEAEGNVVKAHRQHPPSVGNNLAKPNRTSVLHPGSGAPHAGWPHRFGEAYQHYLEQGGLVHLEADLCWFAADDLIADEARFFFFCMMLDQITKEKLAGDIAELGVGKGRTTTLLASIARRLGKTAYIFDAFEDNGLDGSTVGHNEVGFVRGAFPELTNHLPADTTFSLVHIDCDLYHLISGGLQYFYPRMVPGGFIVIHDYSSLAWKGAENAVDEFLSDKPEFVIPLPDHRGSAVIRKIRRRAVDRTRETGPANAAMHRRPMSVAHAAVLERKHRTILSSDWTRAAEGGLAEVLGAGWCAPEPWGVWGLGPSHNLTVHVPRWPQEAVEIDADVNANLLGDRKDLRVEVLVGSEPIANWVFSTERNRAVWTIRIPTSLLTPSDDGMPEFRIELRPDSIASPAELDPEHTDVRALGVALHRLRMRVI